MQPQALNRIPVDILRSRVAQEIRIAILRGDLSPGSRIKQEHLASQLGVSREPVRQALLLLQREGLIHAEPKRGASVAPLDRQLIDDVYGLREALEGTVVQTLARSSRFDVRPFRAIISRGRTAVRQRDFRTLVDLDMAFHTGLYEAAGNRVIVEVMRGQWSQIRRMMSMLLDQGATYRQKIWDEHQAIVEAIHARRPERAVTAAGRHIRAARRVLVETFDAAAPAPLARASQH